MKNNLTQWKTTLTGCILLVVAIGLQYYLFKNSFFELNYFTIGTGICGLGLLFAPDSIIEGIRSIVKKKTE